jgi:predicted metal-dependent hydrolase
MRGGIGPGLALFERGAYFEAHEAWEELWTCETGERRRFLQGLIHVAVALYHDGRGNRLGALRQMRKAAAKLADCGPQREGVDVAALAAAAACWAAAAENGTPPAPVRIRTVMPQ